MEDGGGVSDLMMRESVNTQHEEAKTDPQSVMSSFIELSVK